MDKGDAVLIKENIDKLQLIQKQFSVIESEQKKNENELRKHEENHSSVVRNNFANVDIHLETEISERQESHTEHQIRLNKELQEVMNSLAMKEHLCQQIAANSHHMVDYAAISENEAKIATLEKEKVQLLEQLKTTKTTEATSKLSEQRRKRVQELENQIQTLNKKVCMNMTVPIVLKLNVV